MAGAGKKLGKAIKITDTAHGHPHRHFAGSMEVIEPVAYREIRDRFFTEVDRLKKRRKL